MINKYNGADISASFLFINLGYNKRITIYRGIK